MTAERTFWVGVCDAADVGVSVKSTAAFYLWGENKILNKGSDCATAKMNPTT
jgi:hypothetical protein